MSLKLPNGCKERALLFVSCALFAHVAVSAPELHHVSGEVRQGAELAITGAGFASPSDSAVKLWDSVDNQSSYGRLADGEAVPVDRGPWTRNGNSWSQDVKIARSGDLRHAHSDASYAGKGKGYLGWPRAFKDADNRRLYVSWWFKTDTDPNGSEGHNKFIRIWDSEAGKATRVSWTQILLGGFSLESGKMAPASYAHWAGGIGQWNRLEAFIDSDAGTLKTWTNGKLVHSLDYFEKKDINEGLTIALVGFDPNYGDRYKSLQFRLDDIYASSSPARVELSASASWETAAHKEIQQVEAWSDERISIRLNMGSLDQSESLYLYVIDDGGSVNKMGYKLCSQCPGEPGWVTLE